MPLVAIMCGVVAFFAVANLYRIARILRTPHHLRWELYPVPHGDRSYFEQTEWWRKRPESSRTHEVLYIAREVALLKSVRDHHPALWPWSWAMHLGLYSIVLAVSCALFVGRVPQPLIWFAMLSGIVGTAGVLILRLASSRLRPYTSRATLLNLFFIGAIFSTGLAALWSDPAVSDAMVRLAGALVGRTPAPSLSGVAGLHVGVVLLFLCYLPFTHMTHAYMKLFTYHGVRWDDAASVHDPSAGARLARNLARPVSWSAPHIAGKTWLEVVSAKENKPERAS